MEEPKKKKNEPETEIHWDVIERQYGKVTARPILAQLQQQQPEDRSLLLARELGFGIDELKANSSGKLTLKQRRKLVLPFTYASTKLFYYMAWIGIGLVIMTLLGVHIISYLCLVVRQIGSVV